MKKNSRSSSPATYIGCRVTVTRCLRYLSLGGPELLGCPYLVAGAWPGVIVGEFHARTGDGWLVRVAGERWPVICHTLAAAPLFFTKWYVITDGRVCYPGYERKQDAPPDARVVAGRVIADAPPGEYETDIQAAF